MIQTFSKLELQTQNLRGQIAEVKNKCRLNRPLQSDLLPLTSLHALPCLPAFIEFPRHIGQALAFGLADAIRVLGIEANLAVLIDDLLIQGADHVLFEWNVGLRADRGILKHGHPDAGPEGMPEREAVLAEYSRYHA